MARRTADGGTSAIRIHELDCCQMKQRKNREVENRHEKEGKEKIRKHKKTDKKERTRKENELLPHSLFDRRGGKTRTTKPSRELHARKRTCDKICAKQTDHPSSATGLLIASDHKDNRGL